MVCNSFRSYQKSQTKVLHTVLNSFISSVLYNTMGEKKVTETTNTQYSDVQPYVLHSPLVIAIEKFAWWRRRQVGMNRGMLPGQVIHNSDGSTTKVVSVKAL